MRIKLLLAALLFSIGLSAQDGEPFVIFWPATDLEPLVTDNTRVYSALDRVVLQVDTGEPAFVIEPVAGTDGPPDNGEFEKSVVRLDNSHIVPLTEVYQDFPDPEEAYELDTDLPVGSFDGQFKAAPNGAATYHMPIEIPVGINGMQPTLGLAYNSFGPNGLLGQGWSLQAGLSTISRANRLYYANGLTKPLDLSEDDNLTLDGVRLIPQTSNYGDDGSEYQLESSPHETIILHVEENDERWFELLRSDGTEVRYGYNPDAKLMTEDGSADLIWQVDEIRDQYGNQIKYVYDLSGRCPRIKTIEYTANESQGHVALNQIDFVYGERADVNTTYRAGEKVSLCHLLKRIDVSTGGYQHSSVSLKYSFDLSSLLTEVIQSFSGTVLNPTKFYYGSDIPSNEYTSVETEGYGVTVGYGKEVVSTSDFNGDGISDLLVAEFNVDNDGSNGYEWWHMTLDKWKLYLYDRDINDFVVSQEMNIPDHNVTTFGGKSFTRPRTRMSVGDFYNDGVADIALSVVSKDLQSSFDVYYLKEVFVVDLNYDGSYSVDQTLEQETLSGGRLINGAPMISGDFSGDGRVDFLVDYPEYQDDNLMMITFDSTQDDIENHLISVDLPGLTEMGPHTAIEFDGDGKSELITNLESTASLCKIFSFDFDITSSSYNASVVYESTQNGGFGSNHIDRSYGDFNGDGITDLVENGVVGYGTGSTYAKEALDIEDFAIPESMSVYCEDYDQNGGNYDLDRGPINVQVRSVDFNGDGLSDLAIKVDVDFVVTGAPIPDHSDCPIHSSEEYYKIMYSTGIEFVSEIVDESPFSAYLENIHNDDLFRIVDYNGDGRQDHLSHSSQGISIRTYTTPYRKPLLTKVINGFGRSAQLAYVNLTEDSYHIDNHPSYVPDGPFRNFIVPLDVISEYRILLPSGQETTTSYIYTDPILNVEGRGFVGFRNRVLEHAPSMKRIHERYELHNQSGGNDLKATDTYEMAQVEGSSDQLVSRSLIRLDHYFIPGVLHPQDLNPTHQRFSLPVSQVSHDHVLYTTHLSLSDYSTDYLAEETIAAVGMIDATLLPEDISTESDVDGFNWIEKSLTTMGYGANSGEWWAPYRITSSSSSVIRSEDGLPFVRTKSFTYDQSNGGLLTTTHNVGMADEDGTTLEVEEEVLDRDAFGNPILTKRSSGTLNEEQTSMTYDTDHRFIESITNHLGEVVVTTYHPKWGKVSSHTDRFGRTATTSYDELGRPMTATDPYGNTRTSLWDFLDGVPQASGTDPYSAPDFLYFHRVTSSTGPMLEKRYNYIGQEREILKEAFDGSVIHIVQSYDENLRPYIKTDPFRSGETDNTRITTTLYDDLDRPEHVYITNDVNSDMTMHYDYGFDDGLNFIEATGIDGQVTRTFHDATGKAVKSVDDGGVLLYTFKSYGSPASTTSEGATYDLATMTYDDLGRQTSLSDSNAGTTSYEYDAYGRLTSQTDANENTYSMTYAPDHGRLTNKSGPNGDYSYVYTTLPSGASMLQTETLTNTNNQVVDSKTYTYDDDGRVRMISESIGSEIFVKELSYDSKGRHYLTSHPGSSPIEEQKHFNSIGHVERISLNGTDVWTAGQIDAHGRFTDILKGNTLMDMTYDYHGYPLIHQSGTLFHREYEFNPENGNLDSRKDVIADLEETFIYDDLDRLEVWEVHDLTINGSDITASLSSQYHTNGNIETRSDIGIYSYSFDDQTVSNEYPHAVSSITDPNDLISHDTQDITYTAFNSIATIDEDDRSMTFIYGTDDQRRRATYTVDGTEEWTRTYVGNYERQVAGQTTTETYHIGSPTGLAAIVVVEDGQTDIHIP